MLIALHVEKREKAVASGARLLEAPSREDGQDSDALEA